MIGRYKARGGTTKTCVAMTCLPSHRNSTRWEVGRNKVSMKGIRLPIWDQSTQKESCLTDLKYLPSTCHYAKTPPTLAGFVIYSLPRRPLNVKNAWRRLYDSRLYAHRISHQITPQFRSTSKDFLHGCQMAIARFSESYVFGPSGFWTMALLRYAAKLDPFLSLDCTPTPSTLAQPKERKGFKFCHLATLTF